MRKLITSLTALILTVSIATATVASAVFDPSKDPNGDGKLSIADSTYIQMVLAGKYKPLNLDQLDADNNGVVSYVDAVYYQMLDAGILSMSLNPTASLNASSSETPRTYYVYNATTGVKKDEYSLSVEDDDNTPSQNTASPNQIIGDTDDRVTDWSNRGTAKIIGSIGMGSGFVVDNHTIATAAHVVYNTESNTPTKLTKVLLFDSNGKETSFTPVEYHVPVLFQNHTSYSTLYDYALITIKEDLTDYASYNLGMLTDRAVSNQLSVVTVGFPGVIYTPKEEVTVNNSSNLHTEMMSLGSVIAFNGTDIRYTCDTSGGNSGGPIYAVENINGKTYHTVVGINIAEPLYYDYFNVGYKIDEYVLKFLKGNSNKNY